MGSIEVRRNDRAERRVIIRERKRDRSGVFVDEGRRMEDTRNSTVAVAYMRNINLGRSAKQQQVRRELYGMQQTVHIEICWTQYAQSKKYEVHASCPKCNTNIAHPVHRYRSAMEVFDHTGSATVIAFDKDAACLINQSLDEMKELSIKSNGDELIGKLFSSLTGSKAQFEFKPSTYDIMNHGKTLTVSRISNIQHPYNSYTDRPDSMEPTDTTEVGGTQLTAESSTVQKQSLKNKRTTKVKQEADDCLHSSSIKEEGDGPDSEPHIGMVNGGKQDGLQTERERSKRS